MQGSRVPSSQITALLNDAGSGLTPSRCSQGQGVSPGGSGEPHREVSFRRSHRPLEVTPAQGYPGRHGKPRMRD